MWKDLEWSDRKAVLWNIAVNALESDGWDVRRVRGQRKFSVRQIRRNGEVRTIAIRTSQDTHIAFDRSVDDGGWTPLDEVDAVVVVSVDDKDEPSEALVHHFEADDVRSRFDRAYRARIAAGQAMSKQYALWLALYLPEQEHPVGRVGAGLGLDFPPIARALLPTDDSSGSAAMPSTLVRPADDGLIEPLTIDEAKRRLAQTFGVDPSCVKITIEA